MLGSAENGKKKKQEKMNIYRRLKDLWFPF